MIELPNVYTFDDFFNSDLDGRREFFINADSGFIELEKILFSKFPKLKNQRLIYIPEMVESSFFLDSRFMKLETDDEYQYPRQCHEVSHSFVKKAPDVLNATLYHGFYLIDNLWRLHSWVGMLNGKTNMYLDVTGNESTIAYGRPVHLSVFEQRIL